MSVGRNSLFALVVLTLVCSVAAQEPTRKDPSTQEQTQFARGVVTVIPASPKPEETFDGPMTLQSLLDAYPEIQFGGDSHPDSKSGERAPWGWEDELS